jgi:azurin
MKKPVHNVNRRKKATILFASSIYFVSALAIYLVANKTMRGPGPGEYAGSAVNGSPPEVREQTLPKKQVQKGMDLVDKGSTPPLQRGVKPEQVTKDFEVDTTADVPGFKQTSLKAKVGDVIRVRFKNESNPKLNYRHSWVLTKPGKDGEVMLQADRVGFQHDFIPKTDDVLASSKLIGPGESDIVMFRAPDQPGDYPYICTFPGHGKAMRGTLTIEKK